MDNFNPEKFLQRGKEWIENQATDLNKKRAQTDTESTNEFGRGVQARVEREIHEGERSDLSLERLAKYSELEKQIGNTPLVEIPNALPNGNKLYMKQEYMNGVGHSHYDRVYVHLLKEKERIGLIKPGDHLVETSSGTAGVSFAAIGRRLGYHCHVIIPPGGEDARESAIKAEGAELIYTKNEEAYVTGFKPVLTRYLAAHRDYVFVNHSMGNILGKGEGIENENAIQTMHAIADEILAEGVHPDVVVSALGNGTQTLGLAERFEQIDPNIKVVAWETLLSGVGYRRKYGERGYRRILDENERFDSGDFGRHDMPGTSFPGIHFDSVDKAITLADRVELVADEQITEEYRKKTGHESLPASVVQVSTTSNQEWGRTTLASMAVARSLSQGEHGKTFVILGYDTRDRYDS